MKLISKIFTALLSLGLFVLILAGIGVIGVIGYYSADLPDYKQLADYQPDVTTRLHAGDGRLIAEYATKKRIFVPIESIPVLVRRAFISAEDQNFYIHPGVDPVGIARAMVTNIQHMGTNRRPEGASTITQQVAKNFLLTNDVSIERKIKEAIIAFRIEQAYSKDRILELYLNEIYLGRGTYGVAAAALHYFDKALNELTVAEAAYLAALPKAPNNYQPIANHDAAIARRNWVIGRMMEDNYITPQQAEKAKNKPLRTTDTGGAGLYQADYFTEDVRRWLIDRYGENGLYGGGYSVRTTIDTNFQQIAVDALRDGLERQDRRLGYRGPLGRLDDLSNISDNLADYQSHLHRDEHHLAAVTKVTDQSADIQLQNGDTGRIALSDVGWAKHNLTSVKQILSLRDVILTRAAPSGEEGRYWLRQIPEINGAILAMDPHTGRILAMQGGYAYDESEFNRATQAKRQPGSAFKPFVYLSAVEDGFTSSNLILDAPVVIDQGGNLGKWRPTNYSNDFDGLMPMRVGLEKSKNLMTVRLADHLGMENIAETAERFNIFDNMPAVLSMALGSGETTLMRMANAYAMLVNGGKRITPSLIDRIQDRQGQVIYRHDDRPCPNCGDLINWGGQNAPRLPDPRQLVTDPRHAYQIVQMLEGVVQRGTGRSVRDLNRPVGGKTGTTNDSRDTWFIGFTPDLVVATYVGYDQPKSLGKRATGASVAAPIFEDFMRDALADRPAAPFRMPSNMRLVRVNTDTGQVAGNNSPNAIWVPFIPGSEPGSDMIVLDTKGLGNLPDTNGNNNGNNASTLSGTGGFY